MSMKGMKHTEESINKIKKARAQQTFSIGTRNKMSLIHKGKKQTPEHIEKRVSQYRGEKSPMFGKIGSLHPHWKENKKIMTKEERAEYMKKYWIQTKESKAGRARPVQCEICGSIGKICFDHDHRTGKFRGWICVRCNSALGMAMDNSELLLKMSEYLKDFNQNNNG